MSKSLKDILETNFESIPKIALEWYRSGVKVAIATVISTWSSSPRPIGSQLLVSMDRKFIGSVSGGCVEGAVIEAAIESIENESCKILEFGVSNDDAFSAGLPCGGTIKILVEPLDCGNGIPIKILEQLVQQISLNRKCFLITNIKNFDRCILSDEDSFFPVWSKKKDYKIAFKNSKDSILESNLFFKVFSAPSKLVIVGAVHIAQFLVEIARISGFATKVIDPRQAFCVPEKFPSAVLINEWPDDGFKSESINKLTALVILSHNSQIDDLALEYGVNSDAFYIGCLGSQSNHQKRIMRLKKKGFLDSQIARIHAPIGLSIGARTPSEIAISIMAEIILEQRKIC